jgi:hypothetical protein
VATLVLFPSRKQILEVIGSVMVNALCYKPEGRGFDTR